jgi:DNA-binding NarL/FixJ family response regulator
MLSEPTSRVSRIAVCSPDQLRRDSLAAYLGTLPEFSVAGRVADVPQLLLLAGVQQPDTGIIDTGARAGDLVPAVRLVRDRFPAMRLVVLYDRLSAAEFTALRDCAVAAIVPCSHGLSGLLSVLRGLPGRQHRAACNGSGLTVRQRDILLLVASGHQVSEIARILQISPGTVENHKHRIYAKLNATSAAHAVVRAARLGIIDSTPPRPAGPSAGAGGCAYQQVLAFVVGPTGPVLDDVLTALITRRVPVVQEIKSPTSPQIHWLPAHRGPVVRVLVNPAPEHWRAGVTLGRPVILVHDRVIDQPLMEHALAQGLMAALHADHVAEQLVPVLHLAVAGYMTMDAGAGPLFADSLATRNTHLPPPAPTLTAREHDILRSIGLSRTVQQTARALGIASKTVENAQSRLFLKLGVRNRAAALAAAYSMGLLQPEPS